MRHLLVAGLLSALLPSLGCGGGGPGGGGGGGAGGGAGGAGGAGGSAPRCYDDPAVCDPAASCPRGTVAQVCESPLDLRPPHGNCDLSPQFCVASSNARLFCCPP